MRLWDKIEIFEPQAYWTLFSNSQDVACIDWTWWLVDGFLLEARKPPNPPNSDVGPFGQLQTTSSFML